MSRVGKMPIKLPKDVTINLEGNVIKVKGPKGELSRELHRDLTIRQEDGVLYVERPSDSNQHRSVHGLTRTLVANMVQGVSEGFQKALELQGTGYRAAKNGKKLVLTVGYSHPVEIEPPAGLDIEVPTPASVVVKGADKEAVGQLAANIRAVRLTNPYVGKGIKYAGERVRRKAGKTGK